jgi:asparagine synthase (glutamine-hydrolysing)
MGGFAAVLRFDREAVDERLLERLAGALGGRGRSLRRVESEPPHLRLLLVPRGFAEESLGLARSARSGSPFGLALDGRVDNRRELRARLAGALPSERAPDDAELLLAGYELWGDAVFDRVTGPFAAVVADPVAGRLLLARDPLGGRPLYYRRTGPLLAVASRPAALLAFDGSAPRLDEESIARYLAIEGPRPGATFFDAVRAVRPGEALRIDADAVRSSFAARLAPEPLPARADEAELGERFRARLDAAVACRLPGSQPSAVLMSGGLDSTAVAATAARDAARAGAPPPLAISWVFDELPACDERRWIAAVRRAAGLPALEIVADGLWPLAGEPSWPRPVDSPFLDLYRPLLDRALAAARARGCAALLTGHAGDQLFAGGSDWLPALLGERRFAAAAAALARGALLRARGHRLHYGPRAALARLGGRAAPAPVERPWLTAAAAERLAASARHAVEPAAEEGDAPRRRALLLPSQLALFESADLAAEAAGVELRRPFRDRRLAEFLLAVPAHQLYRPGESKRLLRRALADRLPAAVLRRRAVTSLLPLARRGLVERERAVAIEALRAPGALWPRYVRPEWLFERALPALERESPGVEALVFWHCYTVERWRRTLDGASVR